jgi:hypothetical protein
MSATPSGASLKKAKLQGASLAFTDLQGASLEGALLQAAALIGNLRGASLEEAQLQGAWFGGMLQGASLQKAQLQGSSFAKDTMVWRAYGTPDLDLTTFQDIDVDSKLLEQERDTIANYIPVGTDRDSFLAATAKEPQVDVLDAAFWNKAHSSQPKGEESERRLAEFWADLACSSDKGSSPYVARGLLRNLMYLGDDLPSTRQFFTNQLRQRKSDLTACPGVDGFTDDDWALLDKLVSTAQRPASDEKTN